MGFTYDSAWAVDRGISPVLWIEPVDSVPRSLVERPRSTLAGNDDVFIVHVHAESIRIVLGQCDEGRRTACLNDPDARCFEGRNRRSITSAAADVLLVVPRLPLQFGRGEDKHHDDRKKRPLHVRSPHVAPDDIPGQVRTHRFRRQRVSIPFTRNSSHESSSINVENNPTRSPPWRQRLGPGRLVARTGARLPGTGSSCGKRSRGRDRPDHAGVPEASGRRDGLSYMRNRK